MVREGFSEEVTFKPYLPEVQGTALGITGRQDLGRRNSICRGPGQEGTWPCVRSRQVALHGWSWGESEPDEERSAQGRRVGILF